MSQPLLCLLVLKAESGRSHKETCEGCIVSRLHFSSFEGLVH
jgi:hypothetical protein